MRWYLLGIVLFILFLVCDVHVFTYVVTLSMFALSVQFTGETLPKF
jgi:hypothetical protein